MHKNLIHHIKRKARHITYGNALYDWSLGGPVCALNEKIPQDVWSGHLEAGQAICDGYFLLSDQPYPLENALWTEDESQPVWVQYIHGFSWLCGLKAISGNIARYQARDMIANWIHHYAHWHPLIWNPALTGARIANWIGGFGFYGETADHEFQDDVLHCILKQARHLSRTLGTSSSEEKLYGLDLLFAAKGLIYAGLAFADHEHWLEQGLNHLEHETKRQILRDGMHISRCPETQRKTLKIYIDIQNALARCGYPVPVHMADTIQKMVQALRFFRYTDKGLALFQGAQEGHNEELDEILLRANARGKTLKNLPNAGFERMTIGRSVLMVDASAPPPFPYDDKTHAAPLSFEFTYGKERIFVNTGTHPTDPKWQDVLRNTAAHNSLIIDDRNAAEITPSGHLGRKPRKITVHREDNRNKALIDMSHDGYIPINGITHRRRLYLGAYGHDLRGEDKLTCSIGLQKQHEYAIRFHLHPRVLVSLIRDGREALLRLQNGSGWRFVQQGGAHIALENSIYLGEGTTPRKTKQIVIYGSIESDFTEIKWALQREG